MEYNIYCDESCHLEHDGINAMVIGAVWCPKSKIKEINKRIKEIKIRNNVSEKAELKWTKISPSKIDLYKDIVNYFFDDDDLYFRAVLIPDKSKLNHEKFNQSHNEWYYKMYFEMLSVILHPKNKYDIYIDIKDTNSYKRSQKLKEVCSNSMFDFSEKIIKRLQPIRSDEVQIMQLVDILIGAVCYHNRDFALDFEKSEAKIELVNLISKRSRYSLKKSTLLKEEKFNLFVWNAR